MHKKLKHVDSFTDRHGKTRFYFRRGKGKRIALPNDPDSPEFITAYAAALNAKPEVETEKDMPTRGAAGTFDRLVFEYFQSPDFLRLKPQTQRTFRQKIENFLRDDKVGHRMVREMRRDHVRLMMAKRSSTPAAANDLLKRLSVLMRFAIDCGYRDDNPCLNMQKYKEGTFHTWTEEEIARFEKYWPIGTRERSAFALHLCTGQRVSDVSEMTWEAITERGIRVKQIKTGTAITIPIHRDLSECLAHITNRTGFILKTQAGNGFSHKGLANMMADAIGAAGLPDRCVTHGIRKAAARRLAEAGCTAHQIAAITGHKTLSEVQRYTAAVEQEALAVAAMDKLGSKH